MVIESLRAFRRVTAILILLNQDYNEEKCASERKYELVSVLSSKQYNLIFS